MYKNESSQAPKYAINLAHMKAHRHEEVLGHTTVDLETTLGDCEYEITFHTAQDPEVARNFCRTVKQQAQVGEAGEVQKVRLLRRLRMWCFALIASRCCNPLRYICRDWATPPPFRNESLSPMQKTLQKKR